MSGCDLAHLNAGASGGQKKVLSLWELINKQLWVDRCVYWELDLDPPCMWKMCQMFSSGDRLTQVFAIQQRSHHGSYGDHDLCYKQVKTAQCLVIFIILMPLVMHPWGICCSHTWDVGCCFAPAHCLIRVTDTIILIMNHIYLRYWIWSLPLYN